MPVPLPPPARTAAAHDPFCTWCPLCRGAAVVRSLSPETLARLADLADPGRDGAHRPREQPPGGRPTGIHRRLRRRRRPEATRAAATAAPGRPGSPHDPAPSRPIPVSDADDPQEAPRG